MVLIRVNVSNACGVFSGLNSCVLNLTEAKPLKSKARAPPAQELKYPKRYITDMLEFQASS